LNGCNNLYEFDMSHEQISITHSKILLGSNANTAASQIPEAKSEYSLNAHINLYETHVMSHEAA
jgi:hypothetical protein